MTDPGHDIPDDAAAFLAWLVTKPDPEMVWVLQQLRAENTRLAADNERLRTENEQLHAQLDDWERHRTRGGPPPPPTTPNKTATTRGDPL